MRGLAFAAVWLCGAVAGAQTAGMQKRADDARIPSYSLVSIHKTPESNTNSMWNSTADGFVMQGQTLKEMIGDAYGFSIGPLLASEMQGLPEWCKSERYDVQGKVDVDDMPRLKAMKDKETMIAEVRELQQRIPTVEMVMMQRMLAENFHVKVHYEEREMPVYALTLAKGGIKMTVAHPKDPNNGSISMNNGKMTGSNVPVAFIPALFKGELGRPVVDRTGVDTNYDYELKWAPETGKQAAAGGDNGPSLFTAVEEQLGLKLVPAKAPVWVVVVDRVERPDGN